MKLASFDQWKSITEGVETPLNSPLIIMQGNTFAEKLVNNKEFIDWYKGYTPPNTPDPTVEFINAYLSENPDKKEWFIKRFNLNVEGDKINTNVTQPTELKDETVAADFKSTEVKTKYTGERARNIDLLVSEMKKQGITNKYAIIGMLATIGKESGFVPKNEIPYDNTSNDRIRKIFGSRVKDFTDEELTKLKKNVSKFWDRVYGADDPTGRSQKYGNSEPGDGSKYLGRGFNGITFKANYKKYGDLIGMDLVSNPEVLNDVKVAAKAAVKFLLTVLKGMGIDPNSFTNVADAIKAFVQANHGGHSFPAEGLTKATEVSKNLDIA